LLFIVDHKTDECTLRVECRIVVCERHWLLCFEELIHSASSFLLSVILLNSVEASEYGFLGFDVM
jgi:hypothetical protein